MSRLDTFNFEGKPLSAVLRGGEPWWCAVDVAKILGLERNGHRLTRHLAASEKDVLTKDTLGGKQRAIYVSESGLWALVFKSRKPDAKRFRLWVTSEVLPALRKHGAYMDSKGVLHGIGAPPLGHRPHAEGPAIPSAPLEALPYMPAPWQCMLRQFVFDYARGRDYFEGSAKEIWRIGKGESEAKRFSEWRDALLAAGREGYGFTGDYMTLMHTAYYTFMPIIGFLHRRFACPPGAFA